MWEIHEARHGIMNRIEQIGIDNFNKEAREYYKSWKASNKEKKLTNT